MSEAISFLGWRGLDKPEVAHEYLQPRGATLRSQYIRNGSNLVRLLQGPRRGVDFVTPSTDFGPRTQDELAPLLEPLDLERLPSTQQFFPGFAAGPWDQNDGSPLIIPLLWGDSPMVYDPRTVDGVPDSYADLADPYWKGKVAIRNEMYCVLWMLSSALGNEDPGRITHAQLDEVRALARAIKENAVVAADYREMTRLLVAGEVSVAVSAWQPMCHWAETESEVELRWSTPASDRPYFWVDGYAILRDAPRKDLTYQLINHMLSPAPNAALAWEMQSCSVNREGYPLMHPSLQEMYDPELVSTPEKEGGPLATDVSYLPPLDREGDIAGDADWQAVWLDFLLS
jgi:spermidine/putrescine transport system substrate-binding protein